MIGFPKNFTDVSKYAELQRKQTPLTKEAEEFLKKQADWHEKKGFPHRKVEGWRYFPFQKILNTGYVLSAFSNQMEEKPFPPIHSNSVVLRIQNGIPSFPEKISGFSVFNWKEVLQGSPILPKEIKNSIFQSLQKERGGLCPFNNALALNGLVIVVEESLKQPLEIQYVYSSLEEKPSADNLRNFIFLRDQTEAQVTEVFYGSTLSEPSAFLFNLQTDCFVGKGASLEFVRLDQGGEKDSYLNHFFCELSAEAKACLFTLSLRSGTSRYLTHLFQKEKSISEIRGLSILEGTKHTEHQVTAEHLEEGGESHQFFQSLLFQSARHIFNGMTRITKPAQKTDARQLNRNLILGEKALTVSAPELDIKADDVKAQHGSSTSSLEESRALLFYLQSRGIGLSQALNLILSSFIKETFSPLEKKTRNLLESLTLDHLKSIQPSLILKEEK